jgi:hypothetical protein
MTARQIEQALLAASPEDRFPLAVQLISLALAEDDILSPQPADDRQEDRRPADR